MNSSELHRRFSALISRSGLRSLQSSGFQQSSPGLLRLRSSGFQQSSPAPAPVPAPGFSRTPMFTNRKQTKHYTLLSNKPFPLIHPCALSRSVVFLLTKAATTLTTSSKGSSSRRILCPSICSEFAYYLCTLEERFSL